MGSKDLPASLRRDDAREAVARRVRHHLVRLDGHDDDAGRGQGDAERQEDGGELHFFPPRSLFFFFGLAMLQQCVLLGGSTRKRGDPDRP